jgi:ATP-binding cassette subfamily C protein
MSSSELAIPKKTKRVHTPSLLQMEAVECGAASLGIMLRHFGRYEPLATLRKECGVSRDGSNAASVLRAARRFGMVAKGFSKSFDSLGDFDPPYIIFWHFNHFLVVEGIGKDKIFLNDPASGHRTVTMEEFEEGFTGVVIMMEPGEDFEKGGQKESVISGLKSRLKGFRSALLFAILAGFLLVVPGLVIPAFTGIFLDSILIDQRADWLRPLILAMVVAALAQGTLKFLQLNYLRRFRLSLAAKMSAQFFWHLLKLPVDFYSQRYAGEISERSQLNEKVAGVLSGQLAQTMIDMVMMVFYAALMFFYNQTLTWIGITCAVLNFVALKWLSGRRVEANMRLLQEYGKVSGTSIAGLQSMETIKASGMESGFFHRWSGYFANASNARVEIELANTTLSVLPGLLNSVTTMTVLVLGGYYVINNQLTIGSLVAFQILMRSFLRPVGTMVGLGKTMQELQGDMARLDDVLAHPPDKDPDDDVDITTGDGKPSRESLRLQGRVEIQNMSFGYNPNEPPLIEDFNLRLMPGQRVAFVGGSGSGKTTLAKIVCGLYKPWSGEILLDGVAREELPHSLISNSLSLVDQELLLFGGTVRENLTLWDSTIPDRVLIGACEDAEIWERVQALSGGLEGELSEGGSNLSGGERQRLEIARALANNPSILVLDEATSALDAESERLIAERINLRGCSCILVAHRLSTIRDCDEIIVLEKGKVMERGTHDQLWELDGVYAGLLKTDDGTEASEE